MRDSLYVPSTHRFVTRNWNLPSAGVSLTAFTVAIKTGVLTPLRGARGARVGAVMTSGIALSFFLFPFDHSRCPGFGGAVALPPPLEISKTAGEGRHDAIGWSSHRRRA